MFFVAMGARLGRVTDGGSRDPAGEFRLALIDALVSLPFIDRTADRRLMVNLLRRNVSEFGEVPERDETRMHVIEIVLQCTAVRGGLRALREVLSVMAPKAPGTRRVGQLIDAVTLDSLLDASETDQAHDLLRRAESHHAEPGWWREPVGELVVAGPAAVDLPKAFDDVAARRHEEHGLIGGLVLVDRVAAQVNGPLRIEMVSLTEQIAERLEATERLLTARPDALRMIRLRADEPSGTRSGPPGGRPEPPTGPEHENGNADALSDLTESADMTDIVVVAEAEPNLSGADEEDGEDMSPVAESRRLQDHRPRVWGDVPQRNQEFTGREDLLSRLHDELTVAGRTAVLSKPIHGMGGVGKSQLAIEYVHRHSHEYDLVWWIPSELPGQIETSLTNLAQSLNLDVSPEANSAVRAVKEALSTGAAGHRDWLLVFDNAEDPADVLPFFPTGGSGRIIITSRNSEWGRRSLPIEVDTFTRGESVQFLTKRNPDLDAQDADRLAEALGDLPLAIEQAAAWQRTTLMPVQEYLKLLEDKRLELLEQEPPPDYRATVRAAWKLSLDKLRIVNPGALQLLQVCSYFAPEPISRKLFAGSKIAPELDATLGDTFRLSRAIRDIQRYALAKIDHRNDTLQIHRLIRLVLDDSMDDGQRELMRRGAHTLLANNKPNRPGSRDDWPRYAALRPHVEASRAVESQDPDVQDLVFGMAQYLYYWGDHQGSERLAYEALEYRRVDRGLNDPHTLRLAKWVGWMYFVNGKFKLARELNQETLTRYRDTFGEEDDGTLDAMWTVVADLRVAGKFAAALELDQRALALGLRVLGDDDPAYLAGAHSVGVSLRFLGRFSEALELDSATWQARANLLGSDDPQTMNTRNGMLIDLREAGRYLEARWLQEDLYAESLSIFGKDAPTTLLVARTLAVMRRRAGDHGKALKFNQETLDRYRDRYGDDYPATIATALNLAIDFRHARDLPASRALSEDTVERYRRSFGPRHAFTMSARINLAIVLRHQGYVGAAFEHNNECRQILTEELGADHPLTLTCLTNLASTLSDRGEAAAAYELDIDALARSERTLGAEHPSTLAASVNVALDLAALNRQAESEAILADTTMRLKRVLGERHPATLNAQQHVRADCDADPMPI
jgi:effector-associated domain 2 (EAD2)-containing protein/tetratricopeptide repeat protein/NB-ARC domain-containing protein